MALRSAPRDAQGRRVSQCPLAATERDIPAVAGAKLRSRVVAVAVVAHLAACAVAALRVDSAGCGGCRGGEGEDGEQCEYSAFHFGIISPLGF